MRSRARCYDDLRDWLDTVPVVDCHDHTSDIGPRYTDPVQVVIGHYFGADLLSASSDRDSETIQNYGLSLDERWPVLERAWKRSCHTGYARVTRMVLKRFYGEEELTLDALKRMKDRLADYTDEKAFAGLLDEVGIAARITNPLDGKCADPGCICDGSAKLPPRARIAVPLPQFHRIRNAESVQTVGRYVGATVKALDDYVETCRDVFERYRRFGAVAFKDQSAYEQTIAFGEPDRKKAQELFDWFMADPRRELEFPGAQKPLGDYLFHRFMGMAADMQLPVQVHTGELAGVRNDIRRADALHLIPILDRCRDVRFDLFHVNWPHGDSMLFLGKNYPNVSIDLCWANIIDPVFCQNFLKQALSSMPHGKIHGYGSDFMGFPDRVWAHLSIARDNIAVALSQMVDMEYLSLDEAKQVAREWLYENPKAFYRLSC